MAKHPTSSRVHRDPKHGPDDAFVASVKGSVAWARKHQRALTIVVVAGALLVAGVIYYVNVQRGIETEAAARFTQLQGTIASGNTQLAMRDLQAFVDRFGGSEAGRQARLLLAEIQLDEGEPSAAIQTLGDLADDLDTPRGAAAGRLQAAAHEALGEADEAVDLYLDMAAEARFTFQRREALADAARVRLQNGDPDDAARLYQRLVDTFDEDEAERGYYEMWLAEAQAAARSGAAAPAAIPAADSAPGTDTAADG